MELPEDDGMADGTSAVVWIGSCPIGYMCLRAANIMFAKDLVEGGKYYVRLGPLAEYMIDSRVTSLKEPCML